MSRKQLKITNCFVAQIKKTGVIPAKAGIQKKSRWLSWLHSLRKFLQLARHSREGGNLGKALMAELVTEGNRSQWRTIRLRLATDWLCSVFETGFSLSQKYFSSAQRPRLDSRLRGNDRGREADERPLEFKKLTAGYGEKDVLTGVNLTIKQNEFIAVLGTNGSGKTSLINTVFGLCQVKSGEILFNGENIKNFKTSWLAKNIAAVPQMVNLSYNFLVKDFIDLGIVGIRDDKNFFWDDEKNEKKKLPLTPSFKERGQDRNEEKKLSLALSLEKRGNRERGELIEDLLNIKPLMDRKIMELSSGEFQRVLIAQSLVKNPRIIFLDEPLAHLDLKYQFEILHILKNLKQNGMTVVVVIHDLNLAFQFFDRFVFLKNGEIFADVLKKKFEKENCKKNYKEIIKQVYDLKGDVFDEFIQMQNQNIF